MMAWPYAYGPYATVRTDGGPGMNHGMAAPGMMNPMMAPDQMQQMMVMMQEHVAMTKAIKEAVDRVERRLNAMENMMHK
jgi:hypothetical protein